MTFTGFTQETSDFLWDLAFHNERPWFQEHKEQYLRVLKEPFDALARETYALMQKKYPDEALQLHISRIYRDARRLFGRGPYKDHLWFSIWTGTSPNDNPGFWFEVAADHYSYGVGAWCMTAQQMQDYRNAIDANPAAVERLAEGVRHQRRFHLIGEDYKKPKADRGEILNEWYNKKWLGFECSHDFGGEILKENLPERLADGFGFLWPYYQFLYQFKTQDYK